MLYFGIQSDEGISTAGVTEPLLFGRPQRAKGRHSADTRAGLRASFQPTPRSIVRHLTHFAMLVCTPFPWVVQRTILSRQVVIILVRFTGRDVAPWSWRLSPFAGRRLRQGGGQQHKMFGKKLDSTPAKREKQQVKADKFHFRKGLGPVGQGWQGLRPGQSETAQSHHNQGVGQITTSPRTDFCGDWLLAGGIGSDCRGEHRPVHQEEGRNGRHDRQGGRDGDIDIRDSLGRGRGRPAKKAWRRFTAIRPRQSSKFRSAFSPCWPVEWEQRTRPCPTPSPA